MTSKNSFTAALIAAGLLSSPALGQVQVEEAATAEAKAKISDENRSDGETSTSSEADDS